MLTVVDLSNKGILTPLLAVLSAFNAIGSDEHARSAFVSAVILVVSLIFELLTLVFLIAAAAIYQIYIFPGRLEENYCSLKGKVGFNGIR